MSAEIGVDCARASEAAAPGLRGRGRGDARSFTTAFSEPARAPVRSPPWLVDATGVERRRAAAARTPRPPALNADFRRLAVVRAVRDVRRRDPDRQRQPAVRRLERALPVFGARARSRSTKPTACRSGYDAPRGVRRRARRRPAAATCRTRWGAARRRARAARPRHDAGRWSTRRPSFARTGPAGFVESFTNPAIQFSNDPSTGRRSTLSAPALQGFEVFSGGIQTRTLVTVGVVTPVLSRCLSSQEHQALRSTWSGVS